MSSVLQDLRSGLRIFTHRPGFAAACVLTIAVGMDGMLTIFSFVNAILLRPLPYADAGRLVLLDTRNINRPADPGNTVSPGDFLDWQAQSTSFKSMAAFIETSVSLVLRMVVRQALAMTAAGLLIGLAGALVLTRLLAAYLFEVTPRDPMMLTIAGAVLVALAVVAAFVPARRAASVDPLPSLRAE